MMSKWYLYLDLSQDSLKYTLPQDASPKWSFWPHELIDFDKILCPFSSEIGSEILESDAF